MLRHAAALLPPALLRSGACSVGGFTPSLGGLLSAALLRGSGAAAAASAAASPSGGAAAAAAARGHTSDASKQEGAETISVTFIDKDDTEHTVKAPIGMHLLEVAHQNEIDLEGACEASLACSTCHLIVENEEYFKRIPEAEEDELDMLDLAFGLTETSRLGCQIIAAKDLDGIRVRIPSATRNFYVDGHKPKPH